MIVYIDKYQRSTSEENEIGIEPTEIESGHTGSKDGSTSRSTKVGGVMSEVGVDSSQNR